MAKDKFMFNRVLVGGPWPFDFSRTTKQTHEVRLQPIFPNCRSGDVVCSRGKGCNAQEEPAGRYSFPPKQKAEPRRTPPLLFIAILRSPRLSHRNDIRQKGPTPGKTPLHRPHISMGPPIPGRKGARRSQCRNLLRLPIRERDSHHGPRYYADDPGGPGWGHRLLRQLRHQIILCHDAARHLQKSSRPQDRRPHYSRRTVQIHR